MSTSLDRELLTEPFDCRFCSASFQRYGPRAFHRLLFHSLCLHPSAYMRLFAHHLHAQSSAPTHQHSPAHTATDSIADCDDPNQQLSTHHSRSPEPREDGEIHNEEQRSRTWNPERRSGDPGRQSGRHLRNHSGRSKRYKFQSSKKDGFQPLLSMEQKMESEKRQMLRLKESIPLEVGMSARERCPHNREPCDVFPACRGRACPQLHPRCPNTKDRGRQKALNAANCLATNDCPFEHPEYEKTCERCEDRVRPSSRRFPELLFHCPHRKASICWRQQELGGRACNRPFCSYRHGICPRRDDCQDRRRCYYDHAGIPYFCSHCKKLRVSSHSGASEHSDDD